MTSSFSTAASTRLSIGTRRRKMANRLDTCAADDIDVPQPTPWRARNRHSQLAADGDVQIGVLHLTAVVEQVYAPATSMLNAPKHLIFDGSENLYRRKSQRNNLIPAISAIFIAGSSQPPLIYFIAIICG